MMASRNDIAGREPRPQWLALAGGLIAMAALARLVPHPPNFAPVAAMALFGGAVMRRPLFAFGVPLAALALSDLLLNAWLVGDAFAPPNPWVYGTFILIGLLGLMLRRHRSPALLAAAGLTGSVLFFALTNFGVWATGGFYPRSLDGLAACYVAALPFFVNTAAGDLFWNAVLFGTWAVALRYSAREAGARN